jgi:hypothetical protein
MRISTYRFVVLGSILSSFLVGLHIPMLHEFIEHGRTPRWDVLAATLVLVVMTLAGAWTLLRTAAPLGRASR